MNSVLDSMDECTTSLQYGAELLCDFIVQKLNEESLQQLDNVNNVPRLFRRTNKEVMHLFFLIRIQDGDVLGYGAVAMAEWLLRSTQGFESFNGHCGKDNLSLLIATPVGVLCKLST